jgi:hypothetical protein
MLLTYDDASGRSIIFARADVGERRQEARTPLHSRYNASGWTKAWNRRDLPAAASRISAWVFDAEQCQAFRIGDVSVNETGSAGSGRPPK